MRACVSKYLEMITRPSSTSLPINHLIARTPYQLTPTRHAVARFGEISPIGRLSKALGGQKIWALTTEGEEVGCILVYFSHVGGDFSRTKSGNPDQALASMHQATGVGVHGRIQDFRGRRMELGPAWSVSLLSIRSGHLCPVRWPAFHRISRSATQLNSVVYYRCCLWRRRCPACYSSWSLSASTEQFYHPQ